MDGVLNRARRVLAGMVLLLVACVLGPWFLSGSSEARGASRERVRAKPRHLVICVDGLPFPMLEQMRARGHFSVFNSPARLIAPFPSLTNLGVREVLKPFGVPQLEGYEDYHYNPAKDRMQGSPISCFRRSTYIDGTFRGAFDYYPSPIAVILEYAVPPISGWVDARIMLARLLHRFDQSDASTYIAYLGATDCVAHVGGEPMMRNVLAAVDKACRDIFLGSEGRVDITIFSDHGMHFSTQHKAGLGKALDRADFRRKGNLRGIDTVVQPRYGLVGCAVVFAAESEKQGVAEAAAQATGVDFAAYLQAGVVHVVSRSGHARIEHRDGWYKYSATLEDPLALQPIMARLAAAGCMREDGFVSDADLFEATSGHLYPDVLRRLRDGLTNHVRQPASVIVSLEDGYYEGSPLLDIFAVLQCTHGNMRRDQSVGVLMTTKGTLPPFIRAADALTLIPAR